MAACEARVRDLDAQLRKARGDIEAVQRAYEESQMDCAAAARSLEAGKEMLSKMTARAQTAERERDEAVSAKTVEMAKQRALQKEVRVLRRRC